MIPLATAEQMRAMDRFAMEKAGIPGLDLMERAGREAASEARDMLDAGKGGKRVLVCCGRGNNGGDGFVVSRLLLRAGLDVGTAVFSGRGGVRGDAAVMLAALEETGHPVRFLPGSGGLKDLDPGDLVVDALLGTGLRGEAEGPAAEAIRWMNASGVPILSIDLPSGLDADSGRPRGACVKAERTVTLAVLKRGLVFHPGKTLAGRVRVADIGMPPSAVESAELDTFLTGVFDVRARLPVRPPDGHKGTFGRVFMLAGSTGMGGAAVLASLASLRAGAGLTVLGIPRSLNPSIETAALEVITRPLPQTSGGSLALGAERMIDGLLKSADAAAFGPGLSGNPETADLIRRAALRCAVPLVLDADGLNAFGGRAGRINRRGAATVLTPHAGEMSRLSGLAVQEILADPVGAARRFAKEWGAVVVLKGAPTVIAEPSGRATVNPTGNSGMATAGSGDVLTGLIAGLLAQGASAPDAALCGVYLHGLAGDLAAAKGSARSLIAGDLLAAIGSAFSAVEAAV
jgi:ADP-dependent NAD(P)H-hydrate dehydratase / NAD(P)H-hydrate epimerase